MQRRRLVTGAFVVVAGGIAGCGFRHGRLPSEDGASSIDSAGGVDGDGGMAMATFRRGENSYTGPADTSLLIEEPNSPHGGGTTIRWELQMSMDKLGLIRFDAICGTGGGQIPPESSIVDAELAYVVTDEGAAAEIHEVLVAWDEAAATYNNFGLAAGAQPTIDYALPVIAMAPGTAGTHRITLTSSVTKWCLDPASNHGWIFVPTTTSGVQIASSEEASLVSRPQLAVTYIR